MRVRAVTEANASNEEENASERLQSKRDRMKEIEKSNIEALIKAPGGRVPGRGGL